MQNYVALGCILQDPPGESLSCYLNIEHPTRCHHYPDADMDKTLDGFILDFHCFNLEKEKVGQRNGCAVEIL